MMPVGFPCCVLVRRGYRLRTRQDTCMIPLPIAYECYDLLQCVCV